MNSYKSLKEEAWEANQALAKSGLVFGTFGNVSAADRAKGVFAIKPSGLAYTDMKQQDMVVVDFNGAVVDSKLIPSTDAPTHLVLYQNIPVIDGITHTHSTYATAWAQAMKPIPVLGTTHADFLPLEVPCTKMLSDEQIRGDYEIETGRQIVNLLRNLSTEDVTMVLAAGHGPFTWGATALDSVKHSQILESIAKIAALTLQINPEVSYLKNTLINKHFQRKHGTDAYYGQK